VLHNETSRGMRTFNQSFIEAAAICPFIGDRSKPFKFHDSDIDDMAAGIEEEERRVLKDECRERDGWSCWRRLGIEAAFSYRMCASKMRQLHEEATMGSSGEREDASCRCAIRAATVLLKAVNYAMRDREKAEVFQHLKMYAKLLNHSVTSYARKQPWTGKVHRVLPIHDWNLVRRYKHLDSLPEGDLQRCMSWSGFTSATAWVEPCMIFRDLLKYGAGRACLVFIIDPDPNGGSVYPVDLGDMASFGAQGHELLYPAGQQFRVVSFEGPYRREDFGMRFNVHFDLMQDGGDDLYVVRLAAIDDYVCFTGDYFKDGGDLLEAERFLRARLVFEEENDNVHGKLRCSQALAGLLHVMGKLREAEPIQRRTLMAREETLGPAHPETLSSAHNLACLLQDMGSLREAEHIFHSTLKAQGETLGPTHPDTLHSANNFALLLKDMGKLREAEAILRSTLKARKETLGPTHPGALMSADSFGVLLMETGNWLEAEPVLRSTLKAREETLGPTHPDTLTSAHNLASLLQDMDKLEEAERILLSTLKSSKEILGPTHQHTLNAANTFALLLKDIGKLPEAESIFRSNLEAQEGTLGPTHPDTLNSANNFGMLLKDMGKLPEAELILCNTLKARKDTLGPTHPDTLVSTNNVAVLLVGMDKLLEAEPILRSTLKARKETLGTTHPNTITSADNLAFVVEQLKQRGELRESEPTR